MKMFRRNAREKPESPPRQPNRPRYKAPSTPVNQIIRDPSFSTPREAPRPRPCLRAVLEAPRAMTPDILDEMDAENAQYGWQESDQEDLNPKVLDLKDNIPVPDKVGKITEPEPDGIPKIHVNYLPPINSAGLNHILSQCKPNDPQAQEIIKENTLRLVENGLVEKLGLQASLEDSANEMVRDSEEDADGTDSVEMEELDGEMPIDLFSAQAAHRRFWGAMGDYPKKINT